MNYTPYGFVPYFEEDATALAFNGDHLDKPTQQYLLGNGHRAFSPAIMRFCSPDLQSPFLQGGVNCYCYCSGDPIYFKDPNGQVRMPLKRLNSNRPPSHSGNPRPAQSEALLRGAESSYHSAQRARSRANDALTSSRQFDQDAANSRLSASLSITPASQTQHRQAAEQYLQQAVHHLEVGWQQLNLERRELRNMRRLNSENRELLRNHAENFPPLTTDALQLQTVPTENTLQLENQNIRRFREPR